MRIRPSSSRAIARHFDALLGRQSFARAGLLGIPQLDARPRLERRIALIESEYEQGRVWIEIRPHTVFIKHPVTDGAGSEPSRTAQWASGDR